MAIISDLDIIGSSLLYKIIASLDSFSTAGPPGIDFEGGSSKDVGKLGPGRSQDMGLERGGDFGTGDDIITVLTSPDVDVAEAVDAADPRFGFVLDRGKLLLLLTSGSLSVAGSVLL